MLDQIVMNQMKGLVIDMVHQANSGHPGGALSSLDFAYHLFTESLSYDPDDAGWLGRDRFILSAGHESALLYSLLAFQGFLPFNELPRFRQLHSRTAGHPENILTPGVECTTGPLGQGAAMSVGFAMASRHFQQKLDKGLFDQRVWVIMGDGCIQTPVAMGAASLAAHYRLSNLIWFYDRNAIQISGKTSRATSDDTIKVFEGFGWNTLEIDGHDQAQIRMALQKAKNNDGRPLLIVGNTIMAHGLYSLEGSHKMHGTPLPADERLKTKQKLGLPPDVDFYVSAEATSYFRRHNEALRAKASAWRATLSARRTEDKTFDVLFKAHFEDGVTQQQTPAVTWDKTKPLATRAAFGKIIETWATTMPQLVGGSADLEPSNDTGAFARLVDDFQHDHYQGRNYAFGVREFPMVAICNGLALFGGLKPFTATFLVFSDYARGAIRLGALQHAGVIHEFTHDSFHVGEDGPTHQPIEHVMSLRLIPDLYVMRPCDALETEILLRHAMTLGTSVVFCLTRQNLPMLELSPAVRQQAVRGAYAVNDVADPELVIIATGSEVSLAMQVAGLLKGRAIRIVAMPSWELFERQDADYRNKLLPPTCVRRVSIEAGVTTGWQRYTGASGLNIGIDTFGASAPSKDLSPLFGFTPEQIAARVADHFPSGGSSSIF